MGSGQTKKRKAKYRTQPSPPRPLPIDELGDMWGVGEHKTTATDATTSDTSVTKIDPVMALDAAVDVHSKREARMHSEREVEAAQRRRRLGERETKERGGTRKLSGSEGEEGAGPPHGIKEGSPPKTRVEDDIVMEDLDNNLEFWDGDDPSNNNTMCQLANNIRNNRQSGSPAPASVGAEAFGNGLIKLKRARGQPWGIQLMNRPLQGRGRRAGAYVSFVQATSPAAGCAEIYRGVRIVEVDSKPCHTYKDAIAILAEKEKTSVYMLVEAPDEAKEEAGGGAKEEEGDSPFSTIKQLSAQNNSQW